MSRRSNNIKQSGDGKHTAIQNSEIYVTLSIYDEIKRLGANGDFDEAALLMKNIKDVVGTIHPLYPHYRFKPIEFGNHTILKHEPLTKEAGEKYPLSYRGRFNVPMGSHSNINDLIEEAFINQEEIEIDMVSLSTWLGEYEVPTPNFEKVASESKWVIVPEPLPNPLKLKFYLKGHPEISIIDYLEMHLTKNNETDGVIILDNNHHKQSKLLVSLKVFLNEQTVKINIKIKPEFQNEVEANRIFLSFISKVKGTKTTLGFKNLQTSKDIFTAPNFILEGTFDNLARDCTFIERLYKIEEYFKIKFTLPDEFDKGDWDCIEILEKIMKNTPQKRILTNLVLDFTDKHGLKKMIHLFESSRNVISNFKVTADCSDDARIELFGAIIPLEKVETIYKSLVIKDLEKAKRKYKDFTEGERVKITFLPGNEEEVQVKYFIRDSKQPE